MVLLYAVALSSSDTVTFVVSSIFTRDIKNYSKKYSEESRVNFRIAGTPYVADLNNDGEKEIIISGGSRSNPRLFVFDKNGENLPGWPITTSWFAKPIISDIDGDGLKDIISIIDGYYINRNYNYVFAWNIYGEVLEGFPKVIESGGDNNPLAVDDIDNDRKLELIVSANYIYNKKYSRIYVWELDAPYNPSTMDWPMFQHDPQHTGCYDCDEEISTRVPSQITNNYDEAVQGTLIFRMEYMENGVWKKYGETNTPLTIQPGEIVKLDKLFNPQNILAPNYPSKDKVTAEFVDSYGKKVSSSWEFEVVS